MKKALVLAFDVPGTPQPRGSKSPIPFTRASGKLGVGVKDSNAKSKPFMAVVSLKASEAMSNANLRIINGPVYLEMNFFLRRPDSHFTSKARKSLKSSRSLYHIQKPDVGKLERGVEDAMSGIVYVDDCRVVGHSSMKHWSDVPHTEIKIFTL